MNTGYTGGAEVEQVCLAKALLTQGFDVSFVTYHHGRDRVENVNSVEVIKTYERDKAGKKHVLLKYYSIWAALEEANADVYFHEGGSHGVIPVFCYARRKKFVYRVGSDAVVLSKTLYGNYGVFGKFIDAFEIGRADAVLSQNMFQKRMLKERFGVDSILIKNGFDVPEGGCTKSDPPIVLWVATLSSVKQPHLFVELAKSIPHARFEMVGGRAVGEPQLYEEIQAAAQKVPNLKFHGFIPYHEVNDYFRKASIFVNTSKVEGFPNTFLQAWAFRMPVLSLNVNPDGVIGGEKLGFCSKSFNQLVSDVNTLLEDKPLREEMGNNGRKYVEREHSIHEVAKKYVSIFKEIMQK